MKTIKLALLSSAAIFASACGPVQSDPFGDRKHLRDGATEVISPEDAIREKMARDQAEQQAKNPTPTPVPVDPRVRVSKGLIDIRTEGSLNFIENKASEFLVKARVLQPLNLKYELVFSGLPAGALVTQVDAQTKKVSWTPATGVVEAGKDSKSIKFEVELKQASKLSDAEQKLFNAETTKESFEILVSKTKENPVVQNITGLDGVVSEGSKVKFVIQVRDPGAQGSEAPKVTIKSDSTSSQETVGIDGSQQITADPDQSPSSSAPGIWNFSFIYDTSAKAAPRPAKLGSGNKKLASDEIPVRFKIEVRSPSQRKTETSKEFRLKYNTQGQAPKFDLAAGSNLSVEIGKIAEIDIIVSSQIPNGHLITQAVAARKALQQSLPGGPDAVRFKCTVDGKAPITCKFAWKVPCDEALVGSTQKLALTATNAIGAVVVTGSTEHTITVTKTNETNCTAAKPTAGGN